MVFYSASKMVLLTEFFIKTRFFTLFSPRSFESCTYTHSPLGSFVPGVLNNVQQIRQSVHSSYHQDCYRYLRCVFLTRLASLTHTRKHGGLVGYMIEINCYGPGSVGCIIEMNCYGLRSAGCVIEININGL